MSMEASVAECLGSPAEIADVAVREYRRRKNVLSRSWLAAFCTFVLLPLPALWVAWAASLAAVVAVGEALQWFVRVPSSQSMMTETQVSLATIAMMLIMIVPSALVAIQFGRLARRTSHQWRWGLVALLLVALGTMSGTVSVKSGDGPGKNQVLFGVGVGKGLFDLTHFGQFLIPFATGVIVLRRSANAIAPPISQ